MNSLSWLIYFGDLVSSIVSLVINFTVISLIHTFIISCKNEEFILSKYFKWCVILWVVITILPSKDAIYAIAISEVGEKVLISDTANKSIKALNNWLDSQIDKKQSVY